MRQLTLNSRWVIWLLWGFVLLLGVRFALFLPEAATRPSHGFVAYYTASKLLAEGADSSQFYDVAWFKSQITRFQPQASDVHINPPTTNLLLLPLVSLDYTQARIIWTVLSLFCLGGTVILLVRELGIKGVFLPIVLSLMLWYQPLYANFHLGQAYVFLFGLLVLAWYGYRREQDVLLGIALGLMFVFKLAGIFVLLLLLVQKKWRALAWGAAVSVFVFLFSLPWLGLPAWLRYLDMLRGFSSRPERAVTAYQTIPSFFNHLFWHEPQWNPEPLIAAGWLGQGLSWLATAVLLIITVLVAAKMIRQNHFTNDLLFAIFVILSIVLSPFALDYHYPLLLLPIVIIFTSLITQSARGDKWVWVVWFVWLTAVFAIAADLPYRSPHLAAGAWALLAYPKLYGAILLGGLAIWAIWHSIKRENAYE